MNEIQPIVGIILSYQFLWQVTVILQSSPEFLQHILEDLEP